MSSISRRGQNERIEYSQVGDSKLLYIEFFHNNFIDTDYLHLLQIYSPVSRNGLDWWEALIANLANKELTNNLHTPRQRYQFQHMT